MIAPEDFLPSFILLCVMLFAYNLYMWRKDKQEMKK